ncbi:(2Fe-2S)-binding protein [Roseomonas sp. AR75]|uniref:(2Fe-2S)-binding protein n=1 Tax=Roseomonas sp. AR75 TaxID=2562311 RepID=UPI0010C0299A|nr:(2Fe-2S)-binding protein [Roseomonas sp. AR75]
MGAEALRIAGVARGPAVTIQVDGRAVPAFAGESIATALWAAGIRRLRSSPGGAPRGMFCGMGVCQECVVEVDGATMPACQARVADGLVVRLGPA